MTDATYDAIASEYQSSKQLPFRLYAEAPLLVSLAGDVRGLDILDLACGEGIYARRLKRLGAQRVLGVDISREMIALAEAREQAEPLGVELKVADAATLGAVGPFDMVVGSYLLNYARSESQLRDFCRTIRQNLKPGGRFIGMNDNPTNDPDHYGDYRPYGFIKNSPIPRDEGDPVTYTIFNADGTTFSFDNFYLSPVTYARVLSETFSSWSWRTPAVTTQGVAAMGEDFWRLFREDPPVIGIEARL